MGSFFFLRKRLDQRCFLTHRITSTFSVAHCNSVCGEVAVNTGASTDAHSGKKCKLTRLQMIDFIEGLPQGASLTGGQGLLNHLIHLIQFINNFML